MKSVRIDHTIQEVESAVAKYYDTRSVKFKGFDDGGRAQFANRDGRVHLSPSDLGRILGGYFNKKGDCRVSWHGVSSPSPRLSVWKRILTYEELEVVLRRHNKGFADKGNPKVLNAVVVYIPSASGWKRSLWNCPLKSRSYRTDSAQEPFLEVDPSAGLIRHQHCHMSCLDGSEDLLRAGFNWKVDYCYIEGAKKEARKDEKGSCHR